MNILKVNLKDNYNFYNTNFKGTNSIKNNNLIQNKNIKLLSLGKLIGAPEIINIETKQKEKTLLFYQNTNSNGTLKILKNKPDKINYFEKFINNNFYIYNEYKNSNFCFSENLKNKIEIINSDINNLINDITIAEIMYTTLKKPFEIERLKELGYKKIIKNMDVICIQNFILNQKQYHDAAKLLSIILLKALIQNKDKNIVIKANAFGSDKKSPINLYLRQGFIPLDSTINQIMQHKIQTNKGMRIDPNYTTVMWLPENAIIYNYAKTVNFEPLFQNWFCRIDSSML